MGYRTLLKNRMIAKNYYMTQLAYNLWWNVQLFKKQPIIIYQMGKVGSTSIRDSIENLSLGGPVFQVHALTMVGINRLKHMYYGGNPKIFQQSLLPETKHLFASNFLRTRINKRLFPHVKWKVITLVRDPIARSISEFFYSVDTTKYDPHLPNFYDLYTSNKLMLPALVELFLERFHEKSTDYQIPLRWFDDEFKAVLGVDVYSDDFPKSKGYKNYCTEFADILLLKLENLDQIAVKAINEFLNINNFKLVTSNTAKQKKYYLAYKSFKDSVNLPSYYIDKIYESKYVKHFYGEREIKSFREKWHKSN